ncbi:hypothetical protein [Streptomyces sp. LN325]|uniref:hypothetical protein n=1 Tax=Streptomyces sp. LN325 TaxID=3112976 RepID=UPI00371420EF
MVCRAILLWIVILSALATAFLVGVVLGITWMWRVLARPFRSRTKAAGRRARVQGGRVIDVFAFVALVVGVSAISLCHHAQPMPGVAWFRRLARPHPRPFEDAPAIPELPQPRAIPS